LTRFGLPPEHGSVADRRRQAERRLPGAEGLRQEQRLDLVELAARSRLVRQPLHFGEQRGAHGRRGLAAGGDGAGDQQARPGPQVGAEARLGCDLLAIDQRLVEPRRFAGESSAAATCSAGASASVTGGASQIVATAGSGTFGAFTVIVRSAVQGGSAVSRGGSARPGGESARSTCRPRRRAGAGRSRR
jgi:hypothetical protein